jgi:hypothetical protein
MNKAWIHHSMDSRRVRLRKEVTDNPPPMLTEIRSVFGADPLDPPNQATSRHIRLGNLKLDALRKPKKMSPVLLHRIEKGIGPTRLSVSPKQKQKVNFDMESIKMDSILEREARLQMQESLNRSNESLTKRRRANSGPCFPKGAHIKGSLFEACSLIPSSLQPASPGPRRPRSKQFPLGMRVAYMRKNPDPRALFSFDKGQALDLKASEEVKATGLFKRRKEATKAAKKKELPWNVKRIVEPVQYSDYQDRYFDFINKIALSNYVIVVKPKKAVYKAYVGSGNNSALIKELLMRRGCWKIAKTCSADRLQLCWTQTLKPKILAAWNDTCAQLPLQAEERVAPTFSEEIADYLQADKGERFVQRYASVMNNDTLQVALKNNLLNNKLLTLLGGEMEGSSQLDHLSSLPVPLRPSQPLETRMHNHLPGSHNLGDKMWLHLHLQRFAQEQQIPPPSFLPATFLLGRGAGDYAETSRFLHCYQAAAGGQGGGQRVDTQAGQGLQPRQRDHREVQPG